MIKNWFSSTLSRCKPSRIIKMWFYYNIILLYIVLTKDFFLSVDAPHKPNWMSLFTYRFILLFLYFWKKVKTKRAEEHEWQFTYQRLFFLAPSTSFTDCGHNRLSNYYGIFCIFVILLKFMTCVTFKWLAVLQFIDDLIGNQAE